MLWYPWSSKQHTLRCLLKKLVNDPGTAHQGNIQYGNWRDEQIHRGKEGIAQRDKQVNDYADGGRPSKAPDKIGPPFSYMEECGLFKPLDTIIANPLGSIGPIHISPTLSRVQSLQPSLTGLSTCWS